MSYDPKEYYEAIFQLRNPRDEILQLIDSELKAQKVIVACRRDCSQGMDFYLSSQHSAQNIGKKLQQKFGGELKITKRLFSRSRQTSREIYRVTIYYKPFDFIVGDAVKIDKKIVHITSIGKNNIVGIDLASRKKVNIPVKNKSIEILEIKKAVVSKTYPSLEVIHPETYQSVAVKNPMKINKKEINVVISDDDLFAV